MTLRVNRIETVDGLGGVDADYIVQGSAKMWADVNTSTGIVSASLNLSSITDIGVGQTQFNMSNAMTSSSYARCAQAGSTGINDSSDFSHIVLPTPSSINLNVTNYSAVLKDRAYVTCCLFGDLA